MLRTAVSVNGFRPVETKGSENILSANRKSSAVETINAFFDSGSSIFVRILVLKRWITSD